MPEARSEFSERFSVMEELGKGSFSVVYKCKDKRHNTFFAVKVVKKAKLTKIDLVKLEREARICKKLSHPNIVHLHEVYNEPSFHYFLFDLVTGGELFDDLVSGGGFYSEAVAAKCMFQLLDTVRYCHEMDVVHRDLKPENILLESKERKIIKIADFGLAIDVKENELRWFGMAGTLHYMAPEILEYEAYGRPVDIWSCGVIMYILLVGLMPFQHTKDKKLEELIKNADYDLESDIWDPITEEGKDLVQKLLCPSQAFRLTSDAALQHPWFVKMKTAKQPIEKTNTIERLREFNAKRKLKNLAQTASVLWTAMSIRRRTDQRALSVTSVTSTTSTATNATSASNKKSNVKRKKK